MRRRRGSRSRPGPGPAARAGGLLAAGLLALLVAVPARGQTPLTGTGLGYPVAPADARAAAVGGVAGSLPGGSLSATNPASLTTFRQLTLGFTLSPEAVDVDVSQSAPAQSTGRSRFTVARAVVPFGDWRIGAGFTPELDQDWRVSRDDTLTFGGQRFPFRERRVSDGGLSAANVSVARRIGPVSVGVGADRLTGSLERSFRRSFSPDTLASDGGLSDVGAAGSWAYSGWRARGGLGVSLGNVGHLGVSGALTGDLTAEPDGPAEVRTYDFPASLSASASVRPLDGVLLTGGGGWTGWSSVDGDLREGRAEDTRWAGAGVELSDVEIGPLTVPLRLGARMRELPFAREGMDQITERALTGGFSVLGAGGQASVGVAMEVGTRGDVADAGIAEDFRRFHFTLQIRQ